MKDMEKDLQEFLANPLFLVGAWVLVKFIIQPFIRKIEERKNKPTPEKFIKDGDKTESY